MGRSLNVAKRNSGRDQLARRRVKGRPRVVVAAILIGALGCLRVGSPAFAQSYPTRGRVDVDNPVTLGQPITDSFEDGPSSNTGAVLWQNADENASRTVPAQFDTSAPVRETLPPPVPRLPRYQPRLPPPEKPFTLDYVFLGRAGVDAPSTNVKMNELGFTYKHRFAFGERTTLTVRPLFDVLFLSGPGGGLDLPEQLYKVAIDFQADYQINERWGISAGLTPGFWTDFVFITSADTRLPARLLATFRPNKNLVLAAGLLYTDNIRRNLLPGLGALWDVNDQIRLELMWPRFRAIYKVMEQLQVYGLFERGGDTYNIRTGIDNEDMEYRDYRFALGTQVDYWERATFIAEMGIAFDRRFRFDLQPDADIKRAFFLRLGTRF